MFSVTKFVTEFKRGILGGLDSTELLEEGGLCTPKIGTRGGGSKGGGSSEIHFKKNKSSVTYMIFNVHEN